MNRISPRVAVTLVVVISFLLLAARSRPLARMSGAIEPLLFASGLTSPQALLAQPDGTLLVSAGGPSPGVMQIGAGGDVRPVAGDRSTVGAVLLWPDPGTATELGQGSGTAWGVAVDLRGQVYATLARANQLVRIRREGSAVADEVTRFVGAGGGNPLPTGVAIGPDGAVYVTLFATQRLRPATGQVVRVEQDGRWQAVYEGLTYPVGLGFGANGQLYVLELARSYDERTGRFRPDSGRLLAVGPGQTRRRTVVREVSYPTGLTVTPDGDLFFTENGIFSAPGAGRVLRVPGQGLGG